MRRLLAVFLILIMVLTNSTAYGELGIEKELRSYILADYETGEILEEYNIDEVVEMASISKLMSYVVIMDEMTKKNISLEDIIIIDKDTTKIKGSTFKLKVSEEFTVKELLEASLVVSGNDATYALAKHIAGSEDKFVNLMNKKAKEMGLKNAVFYNSTGLPIGDKGIQNKMTTREIFYLTQYIISNYPQILDITTIRFIDMPSREFFQRNTNPFLMEIEEVDGLKTGFTNKAGYCYVSTFNIGGKENTTKDLRLIGIVMGGKTLEERNDMAKILIEHGLNNYSNKIFLDKDLPLNTLEFPKGTITEVNTYPKENFTKLVNNEENVQVNINIDEIDLPLKKHEVIGKVTVEKDNNILFQTEIIVKEDVKRAKWYVVIARSFANMLKQWGQFFLFD